MMITQDKLFKKWLPTTKKEGESNGWDEIDVIIFSGDAYVDHPSFGAAVIGRVIENEGFRVAIVPQPNWQDDLRDFRKLGKPKYFFGITAGNMDSMVNHYTAAHRLRSNDAYVEVFDFLLICYDLLFSWNSFSLLLISWLVSFPQIENQSREFDLP